MPLPEPDVADLQLRTNLEYLERALAAIGGSLGAGGVNGSVPAGGMVTFAGTTAPSGWLLCQGQSLLRADYPRLFGAIGTTYGSVDGTHFTLPDLQGRAVYGAGPHADVTLGDNEGEVTASNRTPKVTLSAAQSGTPEHSHNMTTHGGGGSPPTTTSSGSKTFIRGDDGGSGGRGLALNANNAYTWGIGVGGVVDGAAAAASSHNHNFLALNYIIKT